MDWPDHTAHRRQWQIGTTSIPLEPGKFFTHWPRWIDPDELTTTYVDQDGKERCYDVGCNLHQKSTKNAYALRVLYLGLYLQLIYDDRDNYAELACTDDQVPQQTTTSNHQLCAKYDPNY